MTIGGNKMAACNPWVLLDKSGKSFSDFWQDMEGWLLSLIFFKIFIYS